jgi:hypothetical protein
MTEQSIDQRILAFVLATHKSHTIKQQAVALKCSQRKIEQARKQLINDGIIKYHRSAWTLEEDEELIDALRMGLPLHRIARRELLQHRTMNAIRYRAVVLGGSRAIRHGVQAEQSISAARSAKAVARLLGIPYSLMSWLIRESVPTNPHRPFEYNRAGYTQPKNTRKPWRYWISDDALMTFLDNKHYWMLYKPEHITDDDWAEYARQARAQADGHWLSVQTIADELHYSRHAVIQWIKRGKLAGTKVKNQLWVWSVDYSNFLEKKSTTPSNDNAVL